MTSPTHERSRDNAVTRRNFLQTTAAASAAAMTANLGTNFAYAQGSGKLKVGLVGCGARGSGAALNILAASPDVELHALGDLFEEYAKASRHRFQNSKLSKDRTNIADDRVFGGWDAYKGVLSTEIDYVILATPPHFRPDHVAAGIAAGKHVFMEKPGAVDPVGVRKLLAAAEHAAQKNLGIVAGTQRRHNKGYQEAMKRIHDGALGDIVSANCYWCQGGLWSKVKRDEWSDMEWQMRNWMYFTWLSGDHIVEQHLHNIDVVNWALDATPAEAFSIGGRQTRTAERFGHIFDHFATEYLYKLEGGREVRLVSMCRQQDGTDPRVEERVHGTKGSVLLNEPGKQYRITGENAWRRRGKGDPNPYEQEHADLVNSIKAGKPLNEGKRIAESTLTAIMGRMSAYSGKLVKWDDALNAELDLTPPKYEFGPLPTPKVAVPGRTPLIYDEWEEA